MTLTEFLMARIAEDEARRMAYWHDVDCPTTSAADISCTCGSQARVMAECEAKRRIVSDCSNALSESGIFGAWLARSVLHLLALPYADHPDFQEEWRP